MELWPALAATTKNNCVTRAPANKPAHAPPPHLPRTLSRPKAGTTLTGRVRKTVLFFLFYQSVWRAFLPFLFFKSEIRRGENGSNHPLLVGSEVEVLFVLAQQLIAQVELLAENP